ncbi:hypothetical protein [Vibrio scophthalmi]|uniref:Uncharacterized protein n=1 Tax=Vibrio scophthalmi TaxID=45658 RepID=A0A1E3WI90_9VIBR|nr:hypothetical protein [Vibrio scophthalmi]ODS04737.1 hypothetical protein VSF3289_03876 [Vibrio scophthalmi]
MIRFILPLIILAASFSVSAGYTMTPYCSGYVFDTDPRFDHSVFKECLASKGITYVRYANSRAFYGKTSNGRDKRYTFFSTSTSCPAGEAPNPETSKCEKQCPSDQKADFEGNCLCSDGSKPNVLGVCEDYCQSEEFNQLKREKMILCTNKRGKFSFSCSSRNDVSFMCNENSGGENGGIGDNGSGGDNGGDTPAPDKPASDKTDDDKDVIAALDKINLDTNTRLDKLLAELEASNKKNTDELGKVNDKLQEASDKNHTDLTNIKGATDDVKNATDGVKTSVEELSGTARQQLRELESIDANLSVLKDGLLNGDASAVGRSVCNLGTCESFYTMKYEDGLEGVLTHRLNAMKKLVTSGIGETFNSVDLGGASRPTYSIQMDFGFVNYGSFDFARYAHLDMVFSFLRAFFMACCMFYARSLIAGG